MTEKLQNPFEIGELITAVNSTIDNVNEKQDTLIAGTNVTIENNIISAKGSIDNVDGVTAIVNENDILQVTGMLEKNTGDAVFDWIGTKEEYNSQNLANTHPDWICFITDDAQDTSTLLEQVNTVKNELTTKAVDSEVVHKTGYETIGGTKRFTNYIITEKGEGVRYEGTNYYYIMRSSGTPAEGCGLFLNNDADKYAFNAYDNKISIGSNTIEAHSVMPTDTTTTSGTQIATTGWVNGTANNLVHKSGNETINGDKVFTSIITATRFLGNNGSNDNCDFKHQTHVGGWYLAGNKHTSEWQQIVTEIGKSLNTNGYFKYDNGMITQWGRSKFSSSQLTITFPISFEGSNYSFIAIATDNKNGGYSYDAVNGVTSRTATSITIYAYYGNQNIDWIAIGY